ncbi:hypothetical protein [Ancylobacter oerskovii]|uniref:Uncharacterized protein n=1 Tax=Ancylobacter oerskovii TaxID=459519 RepID=A0ABW4Z1M9_9HYPH|nr:hypothetical protein [Ancylobacter oerskovii]MBS7544982.1 hypothetical protein [Ancylobacter oerskovii]
MPSQRKRDVLIAVLIFVVSLVILLPVCILAGYAIGYLIAMFMFSASLEPDTYRLDRELFAGIYGIMFIGGALYVLSAGFAAFRLTKAIRTHRR